MHSRGTFEILLKRAYAIPQSCVQGCLISHPEPGAHFTTDSLSVTLRGFCTTRVIARDGPEEKPLESTVKFLERRSDLYDNDEVYDLPIDLHEGSQSKFWVPFPKDPAHKHVPEYSWDEPLCDTVIPQSLPRSGRFGHGNEISYSVEAYMLDLNSGKEIKASIPFLFFPTRDVKEAAGKEIELVLESRLRDNDQYTGFSTFHVAMSSPTVFVPGYSFPLEIRLLPGYPSSSTVVLKGGSVQLLEHTTAQSATNLSMTWHNNHTIVSNDHLPLESDDCAQEITTKGLDIAPLLHYPTIPLYLLPSFECVICSIFMESRSFFASSVASNLSNCNSTLSE